jgi:alkylation response protein AidB-like acyl-CoA dehydrogenase
MAAEADGPEDYDAKLWQVLSAELGVTGLLIPEDLGGLGLDWRAARAVLGELGRGLACVPFLSSCVIAPTVLLAGDAAVASELLPRIADGSAMVAVALGDETLLSADPSASVEATAGADGGWQLSGQLLFVADGGAAHHILVPAADADGRPGWFLVSGDAPGVVTEAMPVVDTTRPQATVRLNGAAGRPVSSADSWTELVGPVLDAAITGLSCEQSAACAFLLELTVAYCKTRFQFGQPIGSFQAVQHRLADLALTVDTTVSAVEYAVAAAMDDPPRWREASSIAGFVCSEAMYSMAAEAIQLHGGVGFTWEHVAHRYYRRALAARPQFGQPSRHRERLLQALSV